MVCVGGGGLNGLKHRNSFIGKILFNGYSLSALVDCMIWRSVKLSHCWYLTDDESLKLPLVGQCNFVCG